MLTVSRKLAATNINKGVPSMLCVSKKEDYSEVGRGGLKGRERGGLGFSPRAAVR